MITTLVPWEKRPDRAAMNDLALLVQLPLNGFLLAGVYALMALGLNLIFGVIRVLNMAHGEMLMIGAFFAFWAWRLAGLNPPSWRFLLLEPVALRLSATPSSISWCRRLENSKMPIEDSSLLLTYGLSSVTRWHWRGLSWRPGYKAVPDASKVPGSSETYFVSRSTRPVVMRHRQASNDGWHLR